MLEARVRITSTFQADDGHKYEILSDSLGAGAQGAVRRGRRSADGRPVAIKRITDGAGRGPQANRELQIALKLHQHDSQHLLAPLAWAIDGADLLLVMPLADHSLAAELGRHPDGMAEDVLLQVLRDIASGLVEPHTADRPTAHSEGACCHGVIRGSCDRRRRASRSIRCPSDTRRTGGRAVAAARWATKV
jgi:serine/threonine protein kinase